MRRPGRRKGTKKTGGRKRGTLNKATLRRREAMAKKSAVVVERRGAGAQARRGVVSSRSVAGSLLARRPAPAFRPQDGAPGRSQEAASSGGDRFSIAICGEPAVDRREKIAGPTRPQGQEILRSI
jgi:hypothetical protein